MANIDVTTCKVALISGGWSDEREIALASGCACEKALHQAGFERVDFIDIAEKGAVSKLENGNYDVAFIAMHGLYGEDGCIQGLCEILHVPYTFSGVLASAMGTEKQITKTLYKAAGIPTPHGYEITKDQKIDEQYAQKLVDELGLPIFVKPATNGSSYGVSRVTSAEALPGAVKLACADGDNALIEKCVVGTEITVPVIGNDEPQALPIVEIVTGAEFYDLKVKYEPSSLHHVIPARLSEKAYKLAQQYACEAHKILGCRGASRSDFIVTADDEPVLLETNMIPGMTETSLLPDSARHAGIEFPELCRKFIEFALERA
ncbi:MAG: D-alanine--D-alanine ligase [Atopobium sp.]|uniref:D-alanine--D-alanine ligase family protein n=1 Tax=Atopobium sp. TaxID=1872650 RepID=UPI002A76377A|nr:D-alanine--D-alanine ligase [Atopobium sp.]MDY2789067.1 D-alanine--D-alanine ligase [Atopobium sp.]